MPTVHSHRQVKGSVIYWGFYELKPALLPPTDVRQLQVEGSLSGAWVCPQARGAVREKSQLLGPQGSAPSPSPVSGLLSLVSPVFSFIVSEDTSGWAYSIGRAETLESPEIWYQPKSEFRMLCAASGSEVPFLRRLRWTGQELYLQEHSLSFAFNSPCISHLAFWPTVPCWNHNSL